MAWRKNKKKKEIKTKADFFEAILGEVRFAWDRQEIREELEGHLEDLQAELAEEGLPEDESEQRALILMGDAQAIGKALNEVHHFWLGCLWLLTKTCMVLSLCSLLFVASAHIDVITGFGNFENDQVEEYKEAGMKYAVQDIEKTVEMEHCTITFNKLVLGKNENRDGCLTYTIKENLLDGGSISGQRIRLTTNRDGKPYTDESNGEPTLANVSSEGAIWRYHCGKIMFDNFPEEATVLYISYQIFGDDWSLEVPLEEVNWV